MFLVELEQSGEVLLESACGEGVCAPTNQRSSREMSGLMTGFLEFGFDLGESGKSGLPPKSTWTRVGRAGNLAPDGIGFKRRLARLASTPHPHCSSEAAVKRGRPGAAMDSTACVYSSIISSGRACSSSRIRNSGVRWKRRMRPRVAEQ